MKLRNLLFILGSLLVVNNISAGIVVRQKPAFTADPIEPYTDNTTSMYMYNVGAKKFFAAGNDWGTCASIADEGYRVYFEQYLVDGAWDGTTVYFRDSCLAKSGERKDVFFDSQSGFCYVDRGSQGNFYWKMEKAENGAYRFSMAEMNPNYESWQVAADSLGRTYFGWRANGSDGTRAKAFIPATDSTCVDWTFHTVAAYDAYQQDLKVFNASETLKEILLGAIELGLTLTEQEAVYNNAASTIEDMEAAVVAAKAAIAAAEEESVDPAAPVDKTSFIVNASFDENKKDGWSGTSGAAGYGTYEFYEKDFDFYQTIEGLPNGVYAVSAQSYLRTGWGDSDDCYNRYIKGIDNDAVIYAANGIDSLTAQVPYIYAGASTEKLGGSETEYKGLETGSIFVPNNMEAASIYFADPNVGPNYKRTVMIAVLDGTLKIGTRQDSHHSGYWFELDNWTLQYYGKKGAAYTMLLENALANAPVFGDDTEATKGMVDAYNTLVAGLTASTYEEATAALASLNAAVAELNENVTLWKNYKDSLTLGSEMAAKGGYAGEAADALMDYTEFDGADYADEMALTTEELKAELTKLSSLFKACLLSIVPGTEIQNEYLYNWDFEDTADGKNDGRGWEGEWGAYGGTDNKCMEAYDNNWDVYQIITEAPQGVYEVSLQGFYRVDRGDAAYALWQNGGQTCPGYVYVNNHLNELPCIFSQPIKASQSIYSGYDNTNSEGNASAFVDYQTGDTILFPNTMQTASEAFMAGMYMTKANGIVVNNGDELRIGVKGKKQSATWVIWDNFKLTYRGKQLAYTKPYLQLAIQEASVLLSKNMEYDTKIFLKDTKQTVATFLESNNEDEVFAAIVDIYAANDAANKSIELYKDLENAANDLLAKVYLSYATDSLKQEGQNLAQTILTGVVNGSYSSEEVETKLVEIQEMLVKLNVVDTSSASDWNPIDFTHVLYSPSYDDGLGGWNDFTGSIGTYEGWINAYEYKGATFDHHQVLYGLPNGTYRIEVNAFARVGNAAQDYALYEVGESKSGVVLYGMSGGSTSSASVNLLGACATDWELCQGATTVIDSSGAVHYVPNDIHSAAYWLWYGQGLNTCYVEVVDGTLRLGIKKSKYASEDWTVMDNWRLYYLGKESSYKPVIPDGPVDDDEYEKEYNINNNFSVSDKKVYHGTTLNIPVSMSNADAITAFQCDLYLSEGVYLNINEDGDYDVVLNSDRATSSHTIATSLLPNGAIRVVAYSSTNKQFKNNEGELFNLNLSVPYNANPLQSVTFKNINVSTPEASEYHIRPIRSNIDVYTYRPADVNDDGQVTVSDLTAVDNYMLERAVDNFIFDAADMDLNGLISVADAVSIVNVLMGGEANYADAVRNPANAQPSYTHTCGILAPEIYRGDSFTLPITLKNEETISAFQCDIYLPEGFMLNMNTNGTYEVALNTARVSDHKLSVSKLSDGALRVIIYSASNAPIIGNDGALFTLGLTAHESVYGDCSVNIRNIRMSTATEEEILASVVMSNVYVHDYIPADVNGDRTVSIVDVVAIVNYLLGDTPSKFIFNAADMDSNGEITIVDVVSVVNALLGGNTYSAQARSIVRSDIHVADAEVMAGETTTLYVQLDNAQSFTAMQMDVNLPVGLSIENVAMVGNGSHEVVCNAEGRIVAYSLSNRPFNAGETLMAITVKADETFIGSAQVDFTNVRVVAKNINETILGDASSTINGGGANGIDAAVATLKVTTEGERIIIETSLVQHATIVSASGIVQQVELVAGKNEVTVNNHGLYLVKIGKKTIKVVL